MCRYEKNSNFKVCQCYPCTFYNNLRNAMSTSHNVLFEDMAAWLEENKIRMGRERENSYYIPLNLHNSAFSTLRYSALPCEPSVNVYVHLLISAVGSK